MKIYFRITKLAQKVVSIISAKQKGEKIYLTLLAKLKQETKRHPYNIIKRAFLKLHPGLKAQPYVKSGKTLYVPTYMNQNNITHFALNCLLDGANEHPKKVDFIERLKIEFLTTLDLQNESFANSFSKEFTNFILSCRFSLKQHFKRYFSKKRYKRQRAYILSLVHKILARRRGIKIQRMTKNRWKRKRKLYMFRKKGSHVHKQFKRKRKGKLERYSEKRRKFIMRRAKLIRKPYLNPQGFLRKHLKKTTVKYREIFQKKYWVVKCLSQKRIKLKRLMKKNIKIKTLLREKIKLKELLINNIGLEKVFLKGLKTNISLRKKFLKILMRNITLHMRSFNKLFIETLKDNILLRRRFLKGLKTNPHRDNFGFSKGFQKLLVENKQKRSVENAKLRELFDSNAGLKTLLIKKIKIRKYLIRHLQLKTPTNIEPNEWLFYSKVIKFTKRKSKKLLKKFKKEKINELLYKERRRHKLKQKVYLLADKKPREIKALNKKLRKLQPFNEPLNFKHFKSRYFLEREFNHNYPDKYLYLHINYRNNNYHNTTKNN